MTPRSQVLRKASDDVVRVVSAAASAVGVFFMLWILYVVALRGAHAINWSFFTQLPTPPGMPGGGLANAIVGTLMITAIAAAMGIPIGLFAGVYLAEFGRHSRAAALVRFVANVLMGTPSIIVGVFTYTLLVLTTGTFSGLAGAAALAFIMLPLMARTAEDILALVPNELRESALALGAPRWKVTVSVVFRASRAGLLTGALLAIARVSGETAPLLFTALNSPYWSLDLTKPTANLTVTVFSYAMSPFSNWQELAWGASLVIILGVLLTTVFARVILHERKR